MRVVFFPDYYESDIITVPDDITEDELLDMACEWVANNVPGFWKVINMTDKEKAAEYLRTIGYDAAEEDGIVLITVAKVMSSKEFKRLKKKIEDSGYHASWGWRLANGR